MMTKKHYIKVVGILCKSHSDGDISTEALAHLAQDFAEWFAEDNERFHKGKFIEYFKVLMYGE